MSAVHEHGEFYAAGTTHVHERVEGGADGAARVQDVVHEHDALSVDVEGDARGMDLGGDAHPEIVAGRS